MSSRYRVYDDYRFVMELKLLCTDPYRDDISNHILNDLISKTSSKAFHKNVDQIMSITRFVDHTTGLWSFLYLFRLLEHG